MASFIQPNNNDDLLIKREKREKREKRKNKHELVSQIENKQKVKLSKIKHEINLEDKQWQFKLEIKK